MKPKWKDAPEWAEYLCMDGDGMWSWFEAEPIWYGDQWIRCKEDEDSLTYWEYANDCPDESGIDWDFAFDTLEKRP